jgi:hypothetical protein
VGGRADAQRLGPLGAGGGRAARSGLDGRADRSHRARAPLDVGPGRGGPVGGRDPVATPAWYGEKAGFVGDARLNFRDDAYVGLRYEHVPLATSTGPEGGFDAGGEQRALSLLLGVGSEWAVGGSAAVGLALIWFLTSVEWE